MVFTGYVLFIIGSLVYFIGEIQMLKLAYRRGLGWFLSCLFLAPLCWFALLAADHRSTLKPFVLAVVGLIVAGVGDSMAGIGFSLIIETA